MVKLPISARSVYTVSMNFELQHVDSSFIAAVGFAAKTYKSRDGVIVVKMASGKTYGYKGRRQGFERLLKAESVGQHFGRWIRTKPVLFVCEG